jgi:SAM-dependent methyltransferase
MRRFGVLKYNSVLVLVNEVVMDRSAAPTIEVTVNDRSVENPWVIEMIGWGGVMLDIGCHGSEYLPEMAARTNRAYGLDIEQVPHVDGVQMVRGDVMNPPLKPRSFDVIVSISAIEHIGCDFYGQIPSEDADMTAMQQIRELLRDDGRLLISVPYGRGATHAWFRVYDAYRLQRLLQGFRPLSIRYYRRNSNQYERCMADNIADAGFDLAGFRSDGLVLAELAKGPLTQTLSPLETGCDRAGGRG